MKIDLFQSCGHCWVFQICWHIECSTFTASSFRIWNSFTGIPSPPLALFVAMLSKAHLTSHSRMSGSRWVITPLWLSRSWRSFLYSSSVYSCHLFNNKNFPTEWECYSHVYTFTVKMRIQENSQIITGKGILLNYSDFWLKFLYAKFFNALFCFQYSILPYMHMYVYNIYNYIHACWVASVVSNFLWPYGL